MKKTLLIALLTLSSFGADEIGEGECVALPSTKKYISLDTSSNYPKKYQFTCDFECRSSDEVAKITALHEVVVSSLVEEAKNVVCYGVKVKRSNWGYDFDSVSKFFSYAAGFGELSEWARSESISVDHENSKYLMDKLIKDLNTILPSYRIASNSGGVGSSVFGDAVEIIELLLFDLPRETERLDQLVLEIGSTDLSSHSGLNLVLRVLSSSAKWRLGAFEINSSTI